MSRIVWHTENLIENACKIADLCRANGISLALVSKFSLSYQPLVLPLLKTAQITTVCDSNCSNFGLFPASNSIENEKKITKTLIKTTAGAIKSLPDLPPDARPDRVFVSHTALLDAIRQLPHNIMPQVVLIAENGDLKEGFDQNQICAVAENYADLDIIGVSSNFSCLTGGLPQIEDVEKLAQTEDYGKVIRAKGMLPSADNASDWLYFDLVPGEFEIRHDAPDYTGKACVIGAELKEELIDKEFR